MAGADEAVFRNEKGNICETSTANIFLADSEKLVTPSPASGALPGITRKVVLELAGDSNIDISEREVSPRELQDSGEAFLTNSIMGIMPLVALNSKPIGRGRPGPVTGLLARKYRERLENLA